MLGWRDVLRNIVPLKMLAAYPDAIQAHYHEDGAEAGALLLLPTHVSPFDRQTYPSSDYVVLLSVTHPRIAQALLARVPGGCALVFKLISSSDRDGVAQRFRLTRATAYISYTAVAGSQFTPSDEVALSERVDEHCFDLYAAGLCTRRGARFLFEWSGAIVRAVPAWRAGRGLLRLPELRPSVRDWGRLHPAGGAAQRLCAQAG